LRRSPENVQPAATAVVDLDKTEDELLARLEKGARYLVRHAQRQGVVIRPGTEADLTPFARMLEETGRRKGFGVRNEAYLRDLEAMVRRENSGEFLVADLGSEAIAAILTGTFGPRSAALYAAGNAQARKVGAQYLLHWEALLRARRGGCRLYDFRGVGAAGDPSDHWSGMTFFKQRFGTRREELPGAWDDVYRPRAYQGFLLAQRARRELPARLRALARTPDRAGSPDRHQNGAAPRRQDQA
jgi:lipid II:glycine glycyltransferase (peptidoglycan interpeptide bridge formation enzyme)